MSYNFKRAAGVSFALYVATFVIGIVAGAVSGQDMSSLDTIPDSFWYVGMLGAVVCAWLFTILYFKNNTLVPSAKSGLFFGLTAVLISSLLDLVLFSAGNAQGASVNLSHYYGDPRFWIILALVLLTAACVGHNKKQ